MNAGRFGATPKVPTFPRFGVRWPDADAEVSSKTGNVNACRGACKNSAAIAARRKGKAFIKCVRRNNPG
jgi:hypothetical protein